MPHTTLIVHHIISLCALYNTCILHYVSKGTILISPYHIPHCTPRQDHSPQSMYYSSAPSWTISPLTQLRSRCGLCFFLFFSSHLRLRFIATHCIPRTSSFCCCGFDRSENSEKPDRTTVPRACTTVLPPLQRSQTGPQSPEHVLQFCPFFREARQDHSPQSMYYSSAPSSE